MTYFSCVGLLGPLLRALYSIVQVEALVTDCQPKVLPLLHADLHYLWYIHGMYCCILKAATTMTVQRMWQCCCIASVQMPGAAWFTSV